MAHLYSDLDEVSPYLKARQKFYTPEAWTKMITALKTSTTLYIGNLSFYTDEEQVYTLFCLCGPVRRVIMGIHKYTHLPCGFCFVEYYFHRDAMAARSYLNGTKLDDRIIRADLDPGFEPGRQYGRGATGGQVRDDRRAEFDEGRGGLPPRYKQRLEQRAVASGTLIDTTSNAPPIPNTGSNRYVHIHRYEQNMTAQDDKKTNNKITNNQQNETQNNENNENNKNNKDKEIKTEPKEQNKNENKNDSENERESEKERESENEREGENKIEPKKETEPMNTLKSNESLEKMKNDELPPAKRQRVD